MHFVEGTVLEIIDERAGLQKVRVARTDNGPGDKAYVLTGLIGTVATGDRVVLNTTAVELNLGTGGWHFVHWNLATAEFNRPGPGHVMKLRYTSLQTDAGSVEEHDFIPPASLAGTPVVGCLLLSQVPAVAAAYKHLQPDSPIVLVVVDQNALPLVLSDLVCDLKSSGLIDATVSTGQAFGGDYESVNVMSGLGIAATLGNAGLIIVSNGLGSVGTGTRLGFSALAIADALDDAREYGGSPILSVRWSDADKRERHQGLSHHSETVMARAGNLTVAVPNGSPVTHHRHKVEPVDVPDVGALLTNADLNVTTMGRGFDEDRSFFQYSAAAGVVAAQLRAAQPVS